MEPGAEDDPFASAAEEFQTAIDSFQTNLDSDKARAEPLPAMSQPVQSAAPDPIPQTPGPTPATFTSMPAQPIPQTPNPTPTTFTNMPAQPIPGTAIPGNTVPGVMTPASNPVMLAGHPQPVMGVPMGMQGVGGMMVPPTTNAVLALVLGILGWVGCGICTSLPGFFIAQSALATAKAYPGHPDTGMATAAKWVSLINLILFVIAIIGYILIFVIAIGSSGLDLGMYQCDNGNTIPESWVNDGWDDCGDGSDEF